MEYKKPVIVAVLPMPFFCLSDAAIAYALDLANGDAEEVKTTFHGRDIVDVEFEEISTSNG